MYKLYVLLEFCKANATNHTKTITSFLLAAWRELQEDDTVSSAETVEKVVPLFENEVPSTDAGVSPLKKGSAPLELRPPVGLMMRFLSLSRRVLALKLRIPPLRMRFSAPRAGGYPLQE